jgi:ferric-dicitrate binding protein FerR (iron transport regulator)
MENGDLLLKYIKNDITEPEREICEKWLNKSEENKQLFDRIKMVWENVALPEPNLNIDKSKAWDALQQKINVESESKTTKTTTENDKIKPNNYYRPLGIAASFLIAVFALWMILTGDKQEMITLSATNTTQQILLDDGTVVFLNRHSTLMYPKKFNSRFRKVDLVGEAYFEVTKNAEYPFVVHNENFDVTVLGTAFDVSANKNDTNAIVTVTSGKVEVKSKAGNTLALIKNETGIVNNITGGVVKQQNSDLNFLSWKNKKLQFKNASFKEVCAKLKNYFRITIEVKNNAIFDCKFTGTFDDPTLENLITILEKTLDVTILFDNTLMTIDGKGCQK